MLGDLPVSKDPRVLVDYRTADDAGVYKLDETRALVQTVDFFTPVVDDPFVYGQIAAKLNKYAKKYRSLSAAADLSEADYVIFFNVVEFRRILNTIYPYGELFVIVKGSPETLKPPRVVWKARKVLFAEDAIGDLIKDLKAIRGET